MAVPQSFRERQAKAFRGTQSSAPSSSNLQSVQQQEEFQRRVDLQKRIDTGRLTQEEFDKLYGGQFEEFGNQATLRRGYAYIEYLQSKGRPIPQSVIRGLPQSGQSYSGYTKSAAQPVLDLTGGYSSQTQGYVLPNQPSAPINNLAQSQNFVASSVLGKNFIIEKSGKVVEPIASYKEGGVIVQDLPKTYESPYPMTKQVIERRQDAGFVENTRMDIVLEIEKELSKPSQRNYTPSDQFAYFAERQKQYNKQFAGGIALGALGSAQLVTDPSEFYRGSERFGRRIFDLKTINGTPQIVLNQLELASFRNEVIKSARLNPALFGGTIIGGAITDIQFVNLVLKFSSRPAVNLYQRARLSYKGISVGSLAESPSTTYVETQSGLRFILVEDIHADIPGIPGLGDVSLQTLRSQTKLGTGEPVQLNTFVRGPLAKAQKGDTFLLREIEQHYGGVRSSPFYSAPEIKLPQDITVRTQTGKNIVVPKDVVVNVGAKQFADDLLGEYPDSSKITLNLLPGKNALVRRVEPIINVKVKGMNTFEAAREFYDPKYSGVTTFAEENIVPLGRPASVERQLSTQSQRVFPFPSRGTLLEITGEELEFPIFNIKELPNFFGDVRVRPAVQKIYEDIGFGRQYKEISLFDATLKIPRGRPPSKAFEGEPIALRPRASAIIQNICCSPPL